MKLIEVFNQLTYGELSQLALGGGEMGKIGEADYPKLLSHINLGLIDLYKRFFLKEGTLVLQLQRDQAIYPLSSRFAVANAKSRETVRYILDSAAAPFRDDINKVERVYTDDGHELSLNDHVDHYALRTPALNVLQVPLDIVNDVTTLPYHLKTTKLRAVYRAAHPQLVQPVGYFDPARVGMELPYSHLQALLLFVASRIHNPVGMTNEFHAGNNYAAKYEAECARLEQANLEIDEGASHDKLRRNGWV